MGKELIAHSIHALSARRTANFVRVNCSAIPADLMEAEFFGYTAGAFTGALKNGKMGRFELADEGSIFLDEVNLLTPSIQPKFLRVLQEMEIYNGKPIVYSLGNFVFGSSIPKTALLKVELSGDGGWEHGVESQAVGGESQAVEEESQPAVKVTMIPCTSSAGYTRLAQ